jgi:ABC-2 type transport system permease protein
MLLALLFGSLALFVGALTGRRALAAGVVVVVAVASYFANTLGPSVDWLAWTRDLSPFRYYSGGAPLRNGLPLGDAMVLAVASAVLIGLAAAVFRRRDIAV